MSNFHKIPIYFSSRRKFDKTSSALQMNGYAHKRQWIQWFRPYKFMVRQLVIYFKFINAHGDGNTRKHME